MGRPGRTDSRASKAKGLYLGAGLLLCAATGMQPALQDSQRTVPAKAQASIDRGIGWLLRAQNRDGSWGDEMGFPGDISNTAIASMALLSTGSTLTRGKHCRQLRKAADWLLRKIENDLKHGGAPYQSGMTIIRRKLGPNIDLYYAALILTQLLPLELERSEAEFATGKLRQLTDLIASYQRPSGQFEMSYEPMLTTVTAYLTLRQAHAVGTTVHGASVEKVLDYLKQDCFEKKTGIFREQKWGNRERFVTQAGGLRVFYSAGREKEADIRKATEVVMRMRFDQDVGGRAGGEEFLAALYATQALHMEVNDTYRKWYAKISKALIKCQNRDGSWTGHHCITGRVFCTACSVMSMLTPKRLLPSSEH